MKTSPPSLATLLVGPLAAPECRRALARGWLILVRFLAALALLGTYLVIYWYWWMSLGADPGYMPYGLLRYGLITIAGMMVTIALVLGPAVLAGSIAGEKQRGVLALLLTTAATPREIVLGRLIGKLTQVATVLLVGAPALVALAALAGMSAATIALLFALPAAVAIGGGGLAVLASTLSRRGRDALLTVYLIDVVFLLTPLGWRLGWLSGTAAWLGALNPFVCLADLAGSEAHSAPLVSIGLWLAIGFLTTAAAAWRLRSACLRPLDGERVPRRRRRWGRVPPVSENRPMLWKELYVEHARALGGLGWWLGLLLVLVLGGGSLVLGGLTVWGELVGVDPAWARQYLSLTVGASTLFVGWLIQWAVGLRAAVAISSERERGTWDALLTSPLQGREIVWSKLLGSLYALRWLLAATLLAWTITAACHAMARIEYAEALVGTLLIATFMAAVGVRTSLSAPTATRAMSVTIGVWLGSHVVVAILSWIVVVLGFMAIFFTISLATVGSFTTPPTWLLSVFRFMWAVSDAIFAVATLLIVADTGLRFDRLAGRMTAGRLATAVDAVVHGRPENPWGEQAPSQNKSEIRNPKSETNPKLEIPNPKPSWLD